MDSTKTIKKTIKHEKKTVHLKMSKPYIKQNLTSSKSVPNQQTTCQKNYENVSFVAKIKKISKCY
jgi:hypothetical protein